MSGLYSHVVSILYVFKTFTSAIREDEIRLIVILYRGQHLLAASRVICLAEHICDRREFIPANLLPLTVLW